jgi:hypothetical protein
MSTAATLPTSIPLDEKDVHPFERAGLGLAPFRFVGVTENMIRHPDGTCQPGGTCDYCANGIRWECHVLSADGKRFKVGCDCIGRLASRTNASTADRALVKSADDAQRRIRNAAARARSAAKREAAAAERAAKWEAGRVEREAAAAARETERAAERAGHVAASAFVLDALDAAGAGSWEFPANIAAELRAGRALSSLSERATELVADIYGKHAGRRGSNAYWTARQDFADRVAALRGDA